MRQILKISFIVLIFTLFSFGFTYLGASALSSRNADESIYLEDTYIGSLDISNKTKGKAKALLDAQWNDWVSNAEIKLSYKEENYQVSPSSFTLESDETIKTAISGKHNAVHISAEDGFFQAKQQLPDYVLSNLDLKKLEEDILLSIQDFNQNIVLQLGNYLPQDQPTIISSAAIKLNPDGQEVIEFVESYPSIELSPESQFSLAAFIQESEMNNLSANTYTLIATAIYKAIQPTNFTISERYISRQLPDNIEPGFEANVNFEKKMDFKFYNPNATPYLVKLNYNNDELEVTIEGSPLLYNYSILTSDRQEFKPRTIKQYSSLLEQGQRSVEAEGTPGVIVKVVREVYKQNGELLRTEQLAEDFYPPVHRVEIHPLAPEVQGVDPETAEENSVLLPSTEGEIPQDNSAQLQPAVPGSNMETDYVPNQNEDDDGLFGKPNEEPK